MAMPSCHELRASSKRPDRGALFDVGECLDLSRRSRLEGVSAAGERSRGGRGSEPAAYQDPGQDLGLVAPAARAACASEAPGERLVAGPPLPEARQPDQEPRAGKTEIVPTSLEDRNRLAGELVGRADVALVQPQLGCGEPDPGPPLDDLFPGSMCPVDDGGEDRLRRLELASLDQRGGEFHLHLSPGGIVARRQRRGPLEQLDRRARVAAPGGALPGCAQMNGGADAEFGALAHAPELGRVGASLLEVVTEELVELD
jgi:hypothetical protein